MAQTFTRDAAVKGPQQDKLQVPWHAGCAGLTRKALNLCWGPKAASIASASYSGSCPHFEYDPEDEVLAMLEAFGSQKFKAFLIMPSRKGIGESKKQ